MTCVGDRLLGERGGGGRERGREGERGRDEEEEEEGGREKRRGEELERLLLALYYQPCTSACAQIVYTSDRFLGE